MMTQATYRKAKRQLLSALLSGVFSDREIDQLATALIEGNSLIKEVGFSLQNVAREISDADPSDKSAVKSTERRHHSDEAEEALRLVKFFGVTQRELFSMLDGLNPQAAASIRGKRLATIAILERFFQHQSTEERHKFIQGLRNRAVHGKGTSDSYLDLISKKLEPN